MKQMSLIVVVPAYNAEHSLALTLKTLPLQDVDGVVIVDDGSFDKTALIAQEVSEFLMKQKPSITFSFHRLPKNKGYGGAQKRCYDLALEMGADVVAMLHADNQYDPSRVTDLVKPIVQGEKDLMLGTRIRNLNETRKGGMPLYKYFANRTLTTIENVITRQSLSEWHTGMRAYSRHTLESIPYSAFSDDFVFDSQMLLSAVSQHLRIGEIPVPVRYDSHSSSISFRRSIEYGVRTLAELARFLLGKYR